MPKKKTVEIVRRIEKAPVPPARQASKTRVRVIPPAATTKVRAKGSDVVQKGAPLVARFENKVGHYELVRVDGDQAYYSFTNLQGRTVDAIMSVTMWRRMQARADNTFQETA